MEKMGVVGKFFASRERNKTEKAADEEAAERNLQTANSISGDQEGMHDLMKQHASAQKTASIARVRERILKLKEKPKATGMDVMHEDALAEDAERQEKR